MKAYAVVETGGNNTGCTRRTPCVLSVCLRQWVKNHPPTGSGGVKRKTLTVGRPYVEKAEVMATVVEHARR